MVDGWELVEGKILDPGYCGSGRDDFHVVANFTAPLRALSTMQRNNRTTWKSNQFRKACRRSVSIASDDGERHPPANGKFETRNSKFECFGLPILGKEKHVSKK